MRAQHDAIAVGVGTVISDDPLLTVRLPGMEDRSPVRVIFDSALRLPLTTQIVMTAREVPVWMVAETGASQDTERTLAPHGIEVVRVPLSDDGVDVNAALTALAGMGITRLMVEGGPHIAQALLKAGLVDSAVIFQSPDSLGEDGIDALSGPHEKALPEAGLNLRRKQGAGEDAVFLYERD
jgi:diaminohydroxyphosphoribosylaminopyrimidine deaminase/5-amino-6-(5-phosphoribosylamino)uracil reductase